MLDLRHPQLQPVEGLAVVLVGFLRGLREHGKGEQKEEKASEWTHTAGNPKPGALPHA